MFSIFRYLFTVLALLGCSANLWAEAALYSSEQQLQDQSTQQMGSATRRALSEVLVRVSGSRDLLSRQDIRMALATSDRYLQQFSFAGFIEGDQGQRLQNFVFKFDRLSVEELLQSAGLPIWPANRPPVLVWYVIEDGHGRRFLNPEEDPGVVAALVTSFQERGLQLQFPLFDLKDSSLVEITDLLRLDRSSIARGGMRYDSSTILAGRLSQLSNGSWVSDSLYILGGQSYAIPAGDGELVSLADNLADFAAVKMSAEYALEVSEESADGLQLYIEGINNFRDYASALEYIESIQAVEQANIEYVSVGHAVFRVYFQGQMRQFQQALALEGRLQRVAALPAELAALYERIELIYRWPQAVGNSHE